MLSAIRPFKPPLPSFSFSFLSNLVPPTSPVRQIVYEFYLICKDGSKDLYEELKFFKSHHKIPLKNQDFLEYRRLRLIRSDFPKLFFFTFFLIIPLSEFLLPPYLFFFPYSIPRNYVKFFLEKRRNSFRECRRNSVLSLKTVKEGILKGKIEDLDSEILINIANFMRMEYFSMNFMINQLVNLSMKITLFVMNSVFFLIGSKRRIIGENPLFIRIKLDFFPFGILRKKIMVFQIKRHLKKLMMEDQKIQDFDQKKLKEIDQKITGEYLLERGFSEGDSSEKMEIWREKVKNVRNLQEFLFLCLENSEK